MKAHRITSTTESLKPLKLCSRASWPSCSGDPSCCPENEGYGCGKPNPPHGFLSESVEKYETAKARDKALAEWEVSAKTGWRSKSAGWSATPFDA